MYLVYGEKLFPEGAGRHGFYPMGTHLPYGKACMQSHDVNRSFWQQ